MVAHVSSSLLHGPDKTGNFIAEASELGFKPGQWPREIHTKTKKFYKFAERLAAGDLQGVIYLGDGGGKLTVFND